MITKLRIAIEASGLKQKHIAKKAGIEATLLSRYVTGDRDIPQEDVAAIAKVLKVPQWNIR